MARLVWEPIGGHQWSLIKKDYNGYDLHLCNVEIENGKRPIVAYSDCGIFGQEVLQELLDIIHETK